MSVLVVSDVKQTTSGTLPVYTRSGGASDRMDRAETQIRIDAALPLFRYGGNRRHYLDMAVDNWPPTQTNEGDDQSVTVDHSFDRLSFVSHKYTIPTTVAWGAVAAASSGTIYNRIVTVGNQIKDWQDANRGVGKWGATFAWAFHHEPNNDNNEASSDMRLIDWIEATENIYTIWTTVCGVTPWQGTQAGITTQEGLLLGAYWIGGTTSGHTDDFPLLWPDDNDFLNDHMIFVGNDAYNQLTDFKPFSFVHQDFKIWTDAKAITQAAAGKVFWPMIGETGTMERSAYASQTHWNTGTMGTASSSNWLLEMQSFVKTSWTDLWALDYWDSTNGSNLWVIDATQAKWDTWMTILQDPYFLNATDPNPTAAPLTVLSFRQTRNSGSMLRASGTVLTSFKMRGSAGTSVIRGAAGIRAVANLLPIGETHQHLPSLTQEAFGTTGQDVSGGIVQTLPHITQSATGVGEFGAAIAQTLPHLTQSAAGESTYNAAAAQTLPHLTQAAEGLTGDAISGAIVQTLPHITQAATGTVPGGAVVAQTLPHLTQSAAALRSDHAMIAQTLGHLAQEADAITSSGGPIDQILPSLTQAAGVVGPTNVFGPIAQTLPDLTQFAHGIGQFEADPLYDPFVQPEASDNDPYSEVLV